MKIDHIGIAVKDINKSLDFYLSLFPEAEYERVSYTPGRMDMVLIQAENVKVELLTPWDDDSAVGKYIARHGEGLHHIAYEVADIETQMEKVEGIGLRSVTKEPYPGAEGRLVFFVHPEDTFGTSHEFCQDH